MDEFIFNEYMVSPDEPHYVLVEKVTGVEHIITKSTLIEKFGTKRFQSISSNTDRYFNAFPYNHSFNDNT